MSDYEEDEVEDSGDEEVKEEEASEEEEEASEQEEEDEEEEEEEEEEEDEEEEEEENDEEEVESSEEEAEQEDEEEEVSEDEENEEEEDEDEEEQVVASGSEIEDNDEDAGSEQYESEEFEYHNEEAYEEYEETHTTEEYVSSTSWATSHGYADGRMPYTKTYTSGVGQGGYNKNVNSFGIVQGLPPSWAHLSKLKYLGPPKPPKHGKGYKPPRAVPHGNQKFGPFEYRPATLSNAKRVLLIGICYFNTDGELRGCHNDVHNMAEFLIEQKGFTPDQFVILTDDQTNPAGQPTRENILAGMRWLVDGASEGDNLFLAYSGHGGSTDDEDGDEDDGNDETICPVDYEEAGQILDDEIHEVCVKPLPAGCRLTALFDCCHSGSIMDLPFLYSAKGVISEPNFMKNAGEDLIKLGQQLKKGNTESADTQRLLAAISQANGQGDAVKAAKTSAADVICFTGCMDSQTSADATICDQAQGALTYAFKNALLKEPNQSYLELLNNLRREMKEGDFTQVPQLSSCHPIDVNVAFTL